MARDPEFRSRVLRLLGSDRRPEDVVRLYSGLRERSFGFAAFREVGDFIAHSEDRSKGVVTDELHDFFTMLRFQTQYWEKEFDWSDLPPDFPRLLKMNFERLSAGHMKQQTGLNRRVAKRHLFSALSNFYKRADGRTYLQHRLSREEQTIVQFCASRSAARSAFTGEGLFRDFQRVLISNKLLEEQEKRLLDAAKPFVILSAIPFIHQAIITLEDGWTCRLAGGSLEGEIVVNAKAAIGHLTFPNEFSSPIVFADLEATDWCDPSLASQAEWQTPVEVTAEPKIIPL